MENVMPPQLQTASRWALLIGIDHYSQLGERWDLSGCVSDVEVMAQLLIDRFAFPAEQVTRLVDGAATQAAILAAMDSLVARVKPGDAVILHYSGHGSQALSSDSDEVDGLDETIVPSDAVRTGDGLNLLDIRDKQINAWLERLTAVTHNVTLIFDSCHSGGVTRDALGAKARWLPPGLPTGDREGSATRQAARPRSAPAPGPSGWLPLGQRYVLLAGCGSSESSFELAAPGADRLHHGALTYFLSRELASAGAGTTYRDVFEAAAVRVAANCSLQHPQLEGEADRTLFGFDRIEPMRYVPVRERSGDQVVLGAGHAVGLSSGSTWAVYPAGTKQAGAGEQPIGKVEITAVQSVTARGKVIEEKSPAAIAAGARAIELSHAYGDLSLAVRILPPRAGEPQCEALAEAIKTSCVLRPARAGEEAAATVHLLAPRREATDPVPQAGRIEEPTWAVVGRGGELILPLTPVRPGSDGRLVENLGKRVRYLAAVKACNPAPYLQNAIGCVLLRQRDDGEWVAAAGTGADERPVYTAGESIAFELTNRSQLPLYFHVLDLGLTGRISPLYPVPGIDKAVPAGKSIRFGTRAGERMPLAIPAEFPFLRPDPSARVVGEETFKVFATTQPADFRLLLQEGYRGGARSALGHLLGIAGGAATRDTAVESLPGEDDWTSCARPFWLQSREAVHPQEAGPVPAQAGSSVQSQEAGAIPVPEGSIPLDERSARTPAGGLP
jgi:hypothetical protein